MKVPPSDVKPPIDTTQAGRKQGVEPSAAEKSEQVRRGAGQAAEDTVEFTIGKVISQELAASDADPAKQKRLDELKRLINSGQYEMPKDLAEKVANVVDEEIRFEKLLNPDND